MLRCPRCGDYDTPVEMLRSWAAEEANRLVAEPVDTKSIVSMLTSYGFDAIEAEALVEGAKSQLRKQNRADGIRRCSWSFCLMVISGVILAASFPRPSGGAIFTGVTLLLVSCTAFINGLLAILTGRDGLFTPDEVSVVP